LQAFARVEPLASLDVGGETSIAGVRRALGQGMPVSIAPLPCDMSAESTTPILDWARRVLEENGGGPLEFVYHLEPDYNVETILVLTEFLKRQGDFRVPRFSRGSDEMSV
jgi:hypothetical protein